MSERNGDKARFQRNRKRKLHQRQRTRAWTASMCASGAVKPSGPAGVSGAVSEAESVSQAASQAMQDEGGPIRSGD